MPKKTTRILLWAALCLAPAAGSQTLDYSCTWLGNTFNGLQNRWVQNFVNEIDVTADGLVGTCSEWDEAGRCSGFYKDGDVLPVLPKESEGASCWGWGTSSRAAAWDSVNFYLVNCEGNLLVFNRRLNFRFSRRVAVGEAEGMTYRDGKLYIVRTDGTVDIRETGGFTSTGAFRLPGASDIAVDDSGTCWILAGTKILHRSGSGDALPGNIEDLENPSAVSMDHRGRLMVCENGWRRQVLFYDVTSEPLLVQIFGDEGGIASGIPGTIKDGPLKFFSLAGAATDAQGNIYVALSRRESILRKFTPDGNLVWEVMSTSFVDAVDPDPDSDGTVVYGVDEIYELDFSRPAGRQWLLRSITRDEVRDPDDPRLSEGSQHTAFYRNVRGHRLLFTTHQMAGALQVYFFRPGGDIAVHAFEKGKGWALWPDAAGNVWHSEGTLVFMEPLTGFASDGKPVYGATRTFPKPREFLSVNRLVYFPDRDEMFVSGFTVQRPDPGGAWGLAGTEVIRYEGWSTRPVARARAVLPLDTWEGGGAHEMVMPKSVAVAGDYIFAAYVWADDESPALRRPATKVFRAATGEYVGSLRPTAEVGMEHGWMDMAYGMSAMRRSDGEYLVFVEEDYRAKQVVYRWRPEGEEGPPPSSFSLGPGWPNPSSAGTRLEIGSPAEADLRLEVLDPLGRRVRLLLDGRKGPGRHEAVWDGRDAAGRRLPSGVFLAVLRIGGKKEPVVRKIVLAR